MDTLKISENSNAVEFNYDKMRNGLSLFSFPFLQLGVAFVGYPKFKM